MSNPPAVMPTEPHVPSLRFPSEAPHLKLRMDRMMMSAFWAFFQNCSRAAMRKTK